MQDSSGTLCITFNGEIYNYRDLCCELESRGHIFRSASDTEVILEAYREWGVDFLSHLNGMFALGLCDHGAQRLLLARDRAGEKPLFYILSNGTLRFASELKALMADPALPRRINPEALDCYLAMGFVPGERCILQGVKKLPPAHALVFNLGSGQSRLWRYWQLPEWNPTPNAGQADEAGLLDDLETLLEDSVRRQLVADVPVGVLLSGGVDSSLITAMAVRATPKVKTFTIRFPGYEDYDETEHARLIARHFSTEHVELEAAESTVDLLPVLARQFDEPMVDSSMIPTFLVSQLIRPHCTVALGGDGGDELFGGYGHYNRLLWLNEKLGWIPFPIRRGISGISTAALPLGFKGRNWIQGLGEELRNGLPLIATYFDASSRRRLLMSKVLDNAALSKVAEEIRGRRIPKNSDLLQRATRMDFENYLAEDILVKVDRTSMLNSLEVRAPFLDYRIIEFAFGKVPSRLKATSSKKKILPKMLAQNIFPAEFNLHRKQGFSIPLAAWLQAGQWKDFFRDVLLGSDGSIFHRRFVADLIDGQARGRSNSERLFALVLFELWRKEYRIAF
jgi:asparagine synthase (glutamine-hydrolysing)